MKNKIENLFDEGDKSKLDLKFDNNMKEEYE